MRPASITQTRRIRPTRRSVSGVYVFRGEKAIEYESTLERDFVIRKAFLTGVVDIVAQPCQIEYRDPSSGRNRTYTPDFFVLYALGDRYWEDYPKPELVEVKPRAVWKRHWRDWMPKWKAARRWAREQGAVFRIYDESRIRDQALQNILFLKRYARMEFPEVESAWVLKNLEAMGMTTIDYLLTRHFMGMYRAEGIAHLWHLIATHRMECDLCRPLCMATEVWVPGA